MTTHKILSLLISKMEELLTANSGLWVNRWVFTTVISLNLSIPNPRLVSPFVLRCSWMRAWALRGSRASPLYNSFCLLLLLLLLAEVTTVAHLPPSNPSILFSSTNLLHVLHYIHVSLSIYLPTHTGHFISYTLLILSALFLCGVASYIEMKSFSNLLLSSREL